MPPRPLSILKAQASYIPLSTASSLLTPRTPFSSGSTSNARPLLQSPFPAVLSTEEWVEEGEDGKLRPVHVVAEPRRGSGEQGSDMARWIKIGLALLVGLGVAGWGVSVWMVAAETEGRQ